MDTKVINLKLSRKLPAEWEKQAFVQFTFPHPNSDWKNLLREVTACYVEMISLAAHFQPVLVVCDNRARVKSFFTDTHNIYFIEIQSDDTWARDHGGITVIENNQTIVLDYTFNGWGNKFDASLDNEITRKMHQQGVLGKAKLCERNFVLEGGSIESDGMGTILTTTKCLLEQNRNPHLSKLEIEGILKADLGASRVLWLENGYLAGDDTDSHIDTLARFCNPQTIAYTGCNTPGDEHFHALQAMKLELSEMTDYQGGHYTLVELPLPDPCFDASGLRLPATYANFLVLNGAVLVPFYGVPQDPIAFELISQCFPGHKAVSINCRVLIEQHGSIHCATMQYPEQIFFGTNTFHT